MISDTERREVARKLREDAANDKLREQVFVEEIIVGCIGETMHDEWGNVREVEILTRLADLIDRPTCKNIADPYDGSFFECSKCGERWELTCGSPADNNLNFCPRCGAEVVE